MSVLDVLSLPLEVIAAGETDRGRRRKANEDAVLVRGDLALYIVADGAGGHSAGNVASAIATSTVAKHFDATESASAERPEVDAFGLWTAARRLSTAVQRANAAVIEIARSSNKYRGMGTTIVCAHLCAASGRLHIAHVGDSRCYRLRAGTLEALTQDHSLLNDVVELHPELDDSAVSKLPRKAVTRALGMEESVRVSVATHRALVGDRYLLCTDGLTGELGGSLLAEMLGADSAPADIVQDLIRAAKEHGGRDNVTALVFECRAGSMPYGRKDQSEPKTRPRGSSRPKQRKPPLPKRESLRVDQEPQIEIAPDPEGSNPEIILLRRTKTTDDGDPRISVVPAESADAQMIRVLDRLADNLTPTLSRCARCHAEYESTSVYCPRCGYGEDEPLSHP